MHQSRSLSVFMLHPVAYGCSHHCQGYITQSHWGVKAFLTLACLQLQLQSPARAVITLKKIIFVRRGKAEMSERPLHLYIIPIHQSLCSANCTISVEATEGQDSRAALRDFSVCPCQLEFAVALAGCIQTQDDGISSARVCMSVCCQGKFRSILFIHDIPAVVRMRRCNVCKCVCVSVRKNLFSCHPLLLPVSSAFLLKPPLAQEPHLFMLLGPWCHFQLAAEHSFLKINRSQSS